MSRTHDADLCDRIRKLEERIAQLEAEKAAHHCGCSHYWWYPVTVLQPPFPITNGTYTILSETSAAPLLKGGEA